MEHDPNLQQQKHYMSPTQLQYQAAQQTTPSEEWEKSFRRNFYSDMSGVSLDEVVDLVRLIRTAAYEKGVRHGEGTGNGVQRYQMGYEAGYEKGVRDSLEVVESLRETPDEVRVMSHTAGYHFGLNRVESKLNTLLT